MGNNYDPVTLHKYLYANADPGNVIDPSGKFGLSSLGTTLNILGNLMSMATTVHSVFQIATGNEELTAKRLGSTILFNMLGAKAAKVIGLFGKRFAKEFRAACGRNSFPSGTIVHTEDGLRPIEEISIGDLVWATNLETGEQELKTVTHLIQGDRKYELFKIAFENGEIITATADHSFFAEDQWINAQDLKVGNRVSVFSDAEPSAIVGIQKEVKEEKVFNLTVDGIHTFHVGEAGYLVHNTNIFCSRNLIAALPSIRTRGAIWNRPLTEVSDQQLYNAFRKNGYKFGGPSWDINHALRRVRDPGRTWEQGIKTPRDLADIINHGRKYSAGGGDVAFSYKGMELIVDPKRLVITTLRHVHKRRN